MIKIPTLFKRDFKNNECPAYNELTPGTEWVVSGEGRATIKWDGTCCMVRDGKLYKRHDCKRGKTPPPYFEPTQEPDPITGHWPGWIPVGGGPEDRWHREAFAQYENTLLPDGTYELTGPKIQGNPQGFLLHGLQPHGKDRLNAVPVTYDELKEYLQILPCEGIVWHHPDGRMAKIKRRDFGFPWPLERQNERLR